MNERGGVMPFLLFFLLTAMLVMAHQTAMYQSERVHIEGVKAERQLEALLMNGEVYIHQRPMLVRAGTEKTLTYEHGRVDFESTAVGSDRVRLRWESTLHDGRSKTRTYNVKIREVEEEEKAYNEHNDGQD
ncbi:hypothetical protein B0H94_11650 [Salsuginibacillus halophilus]|uniref:Competence protein ComGG n=1 Tax=Salsuginibacillus halophilus TaxID=517424 RepID=A0A2P8H7Y7_9BACI|nr:hypothetical protein [Salsuginibacillus halophilus]PSL42345.1 hypothetical protein B0H94_11650 [Salsuginibacillus halophilus]